MEDGYILGRERKRWRKYIVEGGEDIYIYIYIYIRYVRMDVGDDGMCM